MKYTYLFIIIAFTIISRIWLFDSVYQVNPENTVGPDTRRYEQPALHLLETGSLAIEPASENTQTLHTTPVYSLFIAGIYNVFGQDRYPLIITQIFISALTILILYLIAVKLWSFNVALIAMILMAVESLQILFSQMVLAETLFTFFITLSLLTATYLITSKKNEYIWAFLLGLTLAITTMVKPISYYLVVFVIFGFLLSKRKLEYEWGKLLKITTIIILPCILIFGSWQVRNGILTGVYEFSDATSNTMLYWKAKGVLMERDNITREEAQAVIEAQLPSEFNTFKERVDTEKELARNIILDNLDIYLKFTLSGLKTIISGPGAGSQATYYSNDSVRYTPQNAPQEQSMTEWIENKTGYKLWYLFLIAYSMIYLFLVYAFSIYGFQHARKNIRHSAAEITLHFLMLGVAAYFILISSGHIAAYSRMRVPVMPIFILYASYGISTVYSQYSTYRQNKE